MSLLRLMLLVACVALSAVGCSSVQPGSQEILGEWIHSHEEDVEGVRVFRPGSYAFPPSRGREGWEFREGGIAIQRVIAPNDGIAYDTCRWSLSSAGLLTVTRTGDRLPFRFNVLQADAELLRLQVLR